MASQEVARPRGPGGVAAPLAAYVPATQSGSWVFTSGQLPFVDGKLPATGKVGAEVEQFVLDALQVGLEVCFLHVGED